MSDYTEVSWKEYAALMWAADVDPTRFGGAMFDGKTLALFSLRGAYYVHRDVNVRELLEAA